MGRSDHVQVTLQVVARMRQLVPNLLVTYEPGWETRGNGLRADYVGCLVHHTAGLSSAFKPFPSQAVLRDGRSDLPGPLCNESVPWCTVDAPRLHVMAAAPANHAGASGGRSMGPLPVTSLFNPKVRGLEIDYAGTTPMSAGQLLVGHAWARANAEVLAGGDLEAARAHFETSITGKWDIGAGAGQSVDMGAFRRDAANFTITQEDDMGHVDTISVDALKEIRDYVWRDPQLDDGVPAITTLRRAASVLDASGLDALAEHIWRHPQPEDKGVPVLVLTSILAGVGTLLTRPGVAAADIDEQALAAALGPLIPGLVAHLSDDDVDRVAAASADVIAARLVH